MTPVDRCLQKLQPLIEEADLSKTLLAEMAIHELVNDGANDPIRTGSLTILEQDLTANPNLNEPPAQTAYVAYLLDYIVQVRRSLRSPA